MYLIGLQVFAKSDCPTKIIKKSIMTTFLQRFFNEPFFVIEKMIWMTIFSGCLETSYG